MEVPPRDYGGPSSRQALAACELWGTQGLLKPLDTELLGCTKCSSNCSSWDEIILENFRFPQTLGFRGWRLRV